MSGSWLPKWNSSATSLPVEAEETQGIKHGLDPMNASDPQLAKLGQGSEVHTSASTGDLESKSKNTSPRKRSNLSKSLTTRASTTSLVSMSKGNWLSWGPKGKMGTEGEANAEDKEPVDNDAENEDNDDMTGDSNEDNSNDEIDDHVVHSDGNRKKLWTFGTGQMARNLVIRMAVKSRQSRPSHQSLYQLPTTL